MTPTIQAPNPDLQRALTTLESGEEWLLEPKQIGDDECSWSAGVKLGVRAGSWFHQTECFGPVLGLMRADSLSQAIEWQNATAFGLTAGLHSLDPREISQWREHVEAGNLYINRHITGAIVQRQPFGGWKQSSIGPGAKAGGPNYVFNFCQLNDVASTCSADVAANYQRAWDEHFSVDHDPSALHCESNVFRYRACRGVILRVGKGGEIAIARAQLAAKITGVPLTISIESEESETAFIGRLPQLVKHAEFLRTIETPSDDILRAVSALNLNWIGAPFTHSGRLELRFWLREQAISQTRHRYGQISEWLPAARRI